MPLVKNNDSLRSLSKIFTPSSFRKFLQTSETELLKRKIQKHISDFTSEDFVTIVKFLYQQLEANYRNEYIYKNALLNQKLLGKYCLNTTTVLNEFKVGNSIADFVLLNGEIRIFEIKTDLDSFGKLKKQIEDYQKFANKVFIVVSPKNAEKLLENYFNSPVGLISLTNDNVLETIKDAESVVDKFDHTTIFKTLRQGEYIEIIQDFFGKIPTVPNTQLFKESLNLVKKIDVREFQSLVLEKLKERSLKCPELLESDTTPMELKHICYTLNLSNKEYDSLYNILDKVI